MSNQEERTNSALDAEYAARIEMKFRLMDAARALDEMEQALEVSQQAQAYLVCEKCGGEGYYILDDGSYGERVDVIVPCECAR